MALGHIRIIITKYFIASEFVNLRFLWSQLENTIENCQVVDLLLLQTADTWPSSKSSSSSSSTEDSLTCGSREIVRAKRSPGWDFSRLEGNLDLTPPINKKYFKILNFQLFVYILSSMCFYIFSAICLHLSAICLHLSAIYLLLSANCLHFFSCFFTFVSYLITFWQLLVYIFQLFIYICQPFVKFLVSCLFTFRILRAKIA